MEVIKAIEELFLITESLEAGTVNCFVDVEDDKELVRVVKELFLINIELEADVMELGWSVDDILSDAGEADKVSLVNNACVEDEEDEIENDDGPLSEAAIEALIAIDLGSDRSLKLPLALGNSGVYVTEGSIEYNVGTWLLDELEDCRNVEAWLTVLLLESEDNWMLPDDLFSSKLNVKLDFAASTLEIAEGVL